jgi:hypothetical protein
MRNKWASCCTVGNLNFSEDLLALDRELADYVIIHELLHFYVPNHGKLWKSLMRAHLGDYERAESKLRAKAAMLLDQPLLRREPDEGKCGQWKDTCPISSALIGFQRGIEALTSARHCDDVLDRTHDPFDLV